MSESIKYLSDWWRWWSNPLINIHQSHIEMLPYAKKQLEELDYLFFLELRSILSVPDKPDRNLQNQNWLRSFALAEPDELQTLKKYYAVLTLDAGILQTNAQNWNERYGVRSPEEVRELIQLWNQIPFKLKSWQESLILNLSASAQHKFSIDERYMIAMGAYLLNSHPNFFKRWSLTIPYSTGLIIKSIEALPEESIGSMHEWLANIPAEIHKSVATRYPISSEEMPFEESQTETDALSALENLESFDDA